MKQQPYRYLSPRGTWTQGNVDPLVPAETVIHLDDTDQRRVALGLTNKKQPKCRNGSFHITLTRDRALVTCPACLANP